MILFGNDMYILSKLKKHDIKPTDLIDLTRITAARIKIEIFFLQLNKNLRSKLKQHEGKGKFDETKPAPVV